MRKQIYKIENQEFVNFLTAFKTFKFFRTIFVNNVMLMSGIENSFVNLGF